MQWIIFTSSKHKTWNRDANKWNWLLTNLCLLSSCHCLTTFRMRAEMLSVTRFRVLRLAPEKAMKINKSNEIQLKLTSELRAKQLTLRCQEDGNSLISRCFKVVYQFILYFIKSIAASIIIQSISSLKTT